jgi:hypothetical protein
MKKIGFFLIIFLIGIGSYGCDSIKSDSKEENKNGVWNIYSQYYNEKIYYATEEKETNGIYIYSRDPKADDSEYLFEIECEDPEFNGMKIVDDSIFVNYSYGESTDDEQHVIAKCSLDGSSQEKIVQENEEINDFSIYDGVIYYYSDQYKSITTDGKDQKTLYDSSDSEDTKQEYCSALAILKDHTLYALYVNELYQKDLLKDGDFEKIDEINNLTPQIKFEGENFILLSIDEDFLYYYEMAYDDDNSSQTTNIIHVYDRKNKKDYSMDKQIECYDISFNVANQSIYALYCDLDDNWNYCSYDIENGFKTICSIPDEDSEYRVSHEGLEICNDYLGINVIYSYTDTLQDCEMDEREIFNLKDDNIKSKMDDYFSELDSRFENDYMQDSTELLKEKLVGSWIGYEQRNGFPDAMTLREDGTGIADGVSISWWVSDDSFHFSYSSGTKEYKVETVGDTFYLISDTYSNGYRRN